MGAQNKRPIFYDTETTGVRTQTDRIIEIAGYDPVRDRSFSTLVNPGIPIPPASTAISKITDEMVADSPPFSEVGPKFIEFCGEQVVLIAHNNDQFDRPLMETEMARVGCALPAWHYLDSLKVARRYRPDLPRHSLQHLREYYGIAPNEAHRALDDVMMLHQVFGKLVDDLEIEVILELMHQKRQLKRMPFGKYRGQLLREVPRSYLAWLQDQGALDKADNQALKESIEQLGLQTDG